MNRGGQSQSAIGGRFARSGLLLVVALSLLVLSAGPASASSSVAPAGSATASPEQPAATASVVPTGPTGTATGGAGAPTTSAGTSGEPTATWTLDQAKAAVSASDVARLPGATAVFDEAAVRAAIGAAPIRIAVVPFAPVDNTRAAMEQQAYDLNTWGTQQGWPMIVVQGLQVTVGAYDITPGAIADLEPVLGHNDVTHQILRAVTVLEQEASATSSQPAISPTATQPTAGSDPTALPAQVPADPAEVQRIGDALAADRIYNDPGLSQAQTVDSRWANVGPGLVVRAAFLPAVAPGQQLTDLIGPLGKRFPQDVVVVMRGRWIEVAGPDPEILDSALLWLYGNYMKPFLRWVVEPSQAVGLLAGQIGLLRTGVVSNQDPTATATDPGSPANPWLPWLLAGVALLLAGIAGWWAGRSRRNSRMAADAQARSGILRRRRFGARLASVAGRIIELDGMATDNAARGEVDAAVERYRRARDVLTGDGDLDSAGEALDSAQRHLVSAGRILDVPVTSPGDAADGREPR